MSDDFIVNRTFDEIRVGDTASLVRTLTGQDLRLFAALSGDVNPAHLDENYARHFHSGRLVGHNLWSGALISGVLGTKLPGPGTVYESQDLRFLRPVRVGDTVTATVTARAKRADGRTVEFDCRCVNQHDEAVASGVAVVCAPAEHLRLPWPEPLEVAVQEHSKYEALLERCRKLSPARAAVANPCDETRSEVAGDADVLVVPDLEAGNMLAKQLTFMANADAAGVVLGARVPIVLTSRSDNVRTRLASCAVGLLVAHARRAGLPAGGDTAFPDSRGQR